MNRLIPIAACVLCFALGSLLPVRNTHAQTGAEAQTFYQISFMKSRPGQDALKMEREVWKPLHSDRVAAGYINSWTVLQPVFNGPHEYDYITVETSNDPSAFTPSKENNAKIIQLAEKRWGKEKIDGVLKQTEATRDQLGNELWMGVEAVSKQTK